MARRINASFHENCPEGKLPICWSVAMAGVCDAAGKKTPVAKIYISKILAVLPVSWLWPAVMPN
jgi:hypothetical protein